MGKCSPKLKQGNHFHCISIHFHVFHNLCPCTYTNTPMHECTNTRIHEYTNTRTHEFPALNLPFTMKQLPIFDEDKEELKRYYSIGEVAKMFEVSKSLVRFWENEFDFLKPHKNSKGDRRFTVHNIEQLNLIYELVKERGFTIEGARREIQRLHEWEKEKGEWIGRLERVRGFLSEMKEKI